MFNLRSEEVNQVDKRFYLSLSDLSQYNHLFQSWNVPVLSLQFLQVEITIWSVSSVSAALCKSLIDVSATWVGEWQEEIIFSNVLKPLNI